jgi:thymidylate kinase
VSALLAAADDIGQARREIVPRLKGDRIVLLDRYAWTSVARDAARGLDPGWAGALRSPLPAPDLVVLFRQPADVVVARALASRRPSALTAAVADAYAAFARDVMAAHDGLAAGAGLPTATPWPVAVVVAGPGLGPEAVDEHIRAALRPLLGGARHVPGRIGSPGIAA